METPGAWNQPMPSLFSAGMLKPRPHPSTSAVQTRAPAPVSHLASPRCIRGQDWNSPRAGLSVEQEGPALRRGGCSPVLCYDSSPGTCTLHIPACAPRTRLCLRTAFSQRLVNPIWSNMLARGQWEFEGLWGCCRPLALSGPPFLRAQLKGLQEINMEDPFSLAPAI